jgi:PAS domain S-box-containing protein
MAAPGTQAFLASAAERSALRLERMTMTARLTPSAAMANVAGAILVAAVLSTAQRVPLLASWVAVMVLASALRVRSIWPWRPGHGNGPAPTERDMRRYILATTLTGCCWGTAILSFVPIGEARALNFLSMIVLGYAVGSVPSSMPIARASQGYLVGTLLPLAARLALEADAMSYAQAMLLLTFGAVLISYQRSGYANFVIAAAAKLRNERLADELAATQSRLVDALDNTSEAFALYDAETRLVLCNDKYRLFFDLPPEMTVPGTPAEAVVRASIPMTASTEERAQLEGWIGGPVDGLETWIAERIRHLREGTGEFFEQCLPGGRWIRSCYRKVRDGGSVVLHIDISALKLRETALAQAEAEYRGLFENSVVGVYRAAPDGRPVRSNRALAELQGFESEAALAAGLCDVHGWYVDPTRRAEFRARILRDGRVTAFVSEVQRHRTGERIWISENAWVVPGADGAPLWLEGTVLDVTESKRAEEALARARAAEEGSRLKSEFLANMSHELRTPLNAVIGFSEAMLAGLGGRLEDRGRGYVGDIAESGRHLLELINDILDLSKIEAGKLELDEEAVSLAEVTLTCERLIAPRARQAGVTVVATVGTALPAVRGDERRLRQILLNLLSNAVKFTPAGGEVRVEAGLAPAGGVDLVVSDTGIGMRSEDIPVALELFRQVEGALNRRFEGTGLGLPLVKSLTALHGGTFHLESAVGEGTRATVSLPRERVLEHGLSQPEKVTARAAG